MHHRSGRKGKGTFGESLIAALGLIALFLLYWQGKITNWHQLWVAVGLLAVTVAFYFCLLLCKMIYRYMLMGENDATDWQKYAMMSQGGCESGSCGYGDCACGPKDCGCGSENCGCGNQSCAATDCGCGKDGCNCSDSRTCGPECKCGESCNCQK